MEVTELSQLAYLMLLDPALRSPLSDYYMRIVRQGGGQAFALAQGGSVRAYAILLTEGRGSVLSYLCTDPAHRREGLAGQLLSRLVQQTETYLRIHIVRTHPFFEAVQHLAARAGFLLHDVSCVYSCPVGDALWQRMDSLMLPRMMDFLLRDGSACLPFSALPEDGMEQLLGSTQNGFGNTLDPTAFLRAGAAGLDSALSTALLGPDGTLRAYTLVTRPAGDTVCFEQIAETRGEIGSGSIVAPLCSSLERIRALPEIRRLTLTISQRNDRSRDFTLEILKGQDLTQQRNYSFIAVPGAKQTGQP